MTQVDTLESGRIVTDIMTRELSQMTPSYVSNGVNFYAQLALGAPGGFTFSRQELPGSPLPGRTNLLEELFFVTKTNQTWLGIGYVVLTNRPNTAVWERPWAGVGTLYRFSGTATSGQNPAGLFSSYLYTTPFTNLSRILDNVVHFKVRAYDPDGKWITTTNQFATNRFGAVINAVVREPGVASYAFGESEYYLLTTNAVPASVELELGILEERAAERARSISDPVAREKFLAQQAGKVHLFRWRVPVRNVDPTAYQ